MAKKKKPAKKPKEPPAKKTVPVSLSFESRIVRMSPATFIMVEKMLRLFVVDVPGKVAVIPLLDRDGETGCFLYPARTTPMDAVNKTLEALFNKGLSSFIRKMDTQK